MIINVDKGDGCLLRLIILKTKIILSLFVVVSLLLLTSTPSLAVGQRLSEAKRTVCETRQGAIKNRMRNLLALVANMEEKFDSIAARVQKYYTDKVLPTGKTVANYDALVADIQTKKAAVDTAAAEAKTASENFNCNADNPKDLYTTFRTNMQTTKTALHNYRLAIKNLIVAVKGVSPTDNPNPSATPIQN